MIQRHFFLCINEVYLDRQHSTAFTKVQVENVTKMLTLFITEILVSERTDRQIGGWIGERMEEWIESWPMGRYRCVGVIIVPIVGSFVCFDTRHRETCTGDAVSHEVNPGLS